MTTMPVHTRVSAPEHITEMCSYSMDAWVDDISILTDEATLVQAMRDAAEAGGATVLSHTSAIFPNGAVTAVLLLAQSHLSVHTWPELRMANFDLLTCGRLHGDAILDHLCGALDPSRVTTVRTTRDVR